MYKYIHSESKNFHGWSVQPGPRGLMEGPDDIEVGRVMSQFLPKPMIHQKY